MGVDLRELIPEKSVRQINDLRELAGRIIAVDAYNALYQFLSAIRQPDGTPLMDSRGRVTSHLSGLFYRTINLVEAGLKPVYVFDGRSPEMKAEEVSRRRAARQKAEERLREARERGDEEEARRHAQAASRLTSEMVETSKRLLTHMGIPWVQAPSEGEAQAAYMAMKGLAWASASQDYDSLLFGSPRLVRNLAISGRRKLPGRDVYVEVKPEIIDLEVMLKSLQISREQLVDIAILVGTDFNPGGVEGVGPKKAYAIVKSYGSLSRALKALPGARFSTDPEEIRRFFLSPPVVEDVRIEWRRPEREKILELLVEEHEFSRERVENNLERLVKALSGPASSRGLDRWLG